MLVVALVAGASLLRMWSSPWVNVKRDPVWQAYLQEHNYDFHLAYEAYMDTVGQNISRTWPRGVRLYVPETGLWKDRIAFEYTRAASIVFPFEYAGLMVDLRTSYLSSFVGWSAPSTAVTPKGNGSRFSWQSNVWSIGTDLLVDDIRQQPDTQEGYFNATLLHSDFFWHM